MTGLRGASTELRKQMRSRRRLRMVTLVSLAVVVLVVLPAIFGLRAAHRDPIFSSLDALKVPGWAATKVDDRSSGSRWCFIDCRFRERVATSQKPFKETTTAYTKALTDAGWQPWKVAECPDPPIDPKSGTYSCWRRDEFTLDLRVSLPDCAVDAVAAQDPDALPSTGPDGLAVTADPKKCVGSTVSIKVRNAVSDTRGNKGTGETPGLVGETPDTVISDDPLLEPTPTAS
jgi:integrin beta 3